MIDAEVPEKNDHVVRRRRPQKARSGGRAATDRRVFYRPVDKAPNTPSEARP
jgi:hypothetical protein